MLAGMEVGGNRLWQGLDRVGIDKVRSLRHHRCLGHVLLVLLLDDVSEGGSLQRWRQRLVGLARRRLDGLLDLVVVGRRLRRATHVLMGAAMLFHVVLAGEGLVALGAEGVLLASVFLGMTCGVPGRGEKVAAVKGLGQRAGILVLLGGGLGCAGRRVGHAR